MKVVLGSVIHYPLVVPITASYPLVTILLAALFLGEPLTLSRLFGAALIVGGVYFLR
jgi:transporter family protein